MTNNKSEFKFKSKGELDPLRKKSFGERWKAMQERARRMMFWKVGKNE